MWTEETHGHPIHGYDPDWWNEKCDTIKNIVNSQQCCPHNVIPCQCFLVSFSASFLLLAEAFMTMYWFSLKHGIWCVSSYSRTPCRRMKAKHERTRKSFLDGSFAIDMHVFMVAL